MKIDIYTTSGCVYCARAKAALESRRQEFTVKEIPVDEKSAFMNQLQEKFGFPDSKRTFPKIFVDGRLILGYDDLKMEIIRGTI